MKVDLTTIKVENELLTSSCKCLRRCKHLDAFEKYWDNVRLGSYVVDECSVWDNIKHPAEFLFKNGSIFLLIKDCLSFSNLVDHISLNVRPLIKEMKFAFDLAHPLDGWESVILRLLNQLKDLTTLTTVDATVSR